MDYVALCLLGTGIFGLLAIRANCKANEALEDLKRVFTIQANLSELSREIYGNEAELYLPAKTGLLTEVRRLESLAKVLGYTYRKHMERFSWEKDKTK